MIKFKFDIFYNPYEEHTQYAQLVNGKRAKTYRKNGQIVSEFITEDEFNSALAHLMLDINYLANWHHSPL
jgi:hypothetical protein